MGKFIYIFPVVAALVSVYTKLTSGQAIGFTLKGVPYPNGSTVLRDDTGEGDDALHCTTDRVGCCSGVGRAGEFYFPDDTIVPVSGGDLTRTYYRNRILGAIRLNRRSNGTITGRFRCEIPDINGTLVNLYMNIVTKIVIAGSGSNTAGETYTLECSVFGVNVSVTFRWFEENGTQINTSSSRSITLSPFNSQLRFSPLHVSHRGNYTCQATILEAVESKSALVSVNVPSVLVQISNQTTPRPGHTLSLTCSFSGAENLDATITYQWMKSNDTQTDTPVGTNASSLSIPSLRLSDIGQYTCLITVRSNYLLGPLEVRSRSYELQIPIPQPTVHLISSKPNPVLSGTSLSLTCSIELNSVVDVPLTITTLWTGPDGSVLAPVRHAAAASLTHYISRSVYRSVESADSGDHTCTVTIGSEVRMSVKKSIIVGDGMFQLKLIRMEDCQLWTVRL